MFFCHLLTFFKINFFEQFFQKHYQGVVPDLDTNCLQRLSAEVKSQWLLATVKSEIFERKLFSRISLIDIIAKLINLQLWHDLRSYISKGQRVFAIL